ncbi:DNA polymerase III subunit gamma/tau [soil metagenome]
MASTVPGPSQHQAIYRRWRAQNFSQLVGQTAVVETLRNAVRLERLAHGLLFVGPRGTGKTSMARILAKAVNCTEPNDGEPCDACPSCDSIREGRALDVVELDAASNNKVDDMRELLPRVYTAASDLQRKVFIIDEVQRIKEGWDVLLKTLEEPPDRVLFIFCTTNPAQIRPAVVSRLQRFTFRPLTVPEIEGKLQLILQGDRRRAEPDAVRLIADLAAGGMRDAEAMLDQVLNTAGDVVTSAAVRELVGLADAESVAAFVEALVTGDALAGIRVLDELEGSGRDLVAFADQLISRLRQLLVDRLSGRTTPGAVGSATPSDLARISRRLTGLDANRSSSGGFRFQLELCLLQSPPSIGLATFDPVVPAGKPSPRPPVRQEALPPSSSSPSATVAAAPTSASSPAVSVSPATHRPPPAVAPSLPPGSEAVRSGGPPDSRIVAAASEDALERLRTGWPEVVTQVGRNPAYRPLIEVCRPVDVRDGIVVLGFPEDKSFLRDRAEQKRTIFEDALRSVMGRAYGVRCVSTNIEALEPLPGAVGEVDLFEHAQRVFEGDVAGVSEIR